MATNKRIIVRKSKDSDIYVAYGYIRIIGKGSKWGMIWFTGKTYMEAITAAMSY